MREAWPEGASLDDILCDHHHPGAEFVPAGGFGDLRLLDCEASRLAVYAITGRTVEQLDDERVGRLMDLAGDCAAEFTFEPDPAG